MPDTLPLAKSRRRILIVIALISGLILSAVIFTTLHIFDAILEDKKVAVTNRMNLLKNLIESDTQADYRGFIRSLLRAYQASINKMPLGPMEYALVGRLDDRLVFLLRGRGDPDAKRHPVFFYLLEEDGSPQFLASDNVITPALIKAMDGKSGVVEGKVETRGEFVICYSPLEVEIGRLALMVGLPLGPVKKAMMKQAVFILLLSLVLIAVGGWIFLRLNPMLAELSHSQEMTIQMLGDASHHKDTDTGWHVERMADYSAAIGRAMKLPAKQVLVLKLAARMHDLGKVGTPDKILKKPAKLNLEEWKVMREHSSVGAEIMAKGDTPLFEMAREIALGHHEKWDGSGYPNNKKGEEIPLVSRITAVADVFDALTMKRPYKEAWPEEKAFAVIQEDSGSHFAPEVVAAFMGIKEEILAIKDHWDKKERMAGQ